MIRLAILLFLIIYIPFVNGQCTDLTPQFTPNQSFFCNSGPHTLTLANNSTGINNTTATYEWYLDDVLTSTTTGLGSPGNITLTNLGTYTVKLVATDTAACKDSTLINIEVISPPNASFTFEPDGECAGTTISFNNTSGNTILGSTYNWDFGDGNTSNQENPTHNYSAGGNYTVTLTVENFTGCSDIYSATVNSLDIPISSGIIGDDGDGNTINCLVPGDPTTTQTVSFFNNTTGAISYSWDFGDGNTSTDPDPSHTYNSYGTFPVTMTATSANGCSITETIDVVFEKFVSSSLVLDVTEYSGCAPFNLTTLTNNSVNANNFVWDFGDGSPVYNTTSTTPPNHEYTAAGTYTISLSASNSCNTANATISPIIIIDKPEVDFSISGNTGCAPANLTFTNNSTNASPANDFDWDMDNGNTYTTTITPPGQVYNNAGTYTISLTAGNACGDSTLTRTINLDTIPIADFDLLPDEGCSPLTVNVNNTSIGNVTQYRWTRSGYGYSYGPNYGPFTYTYGPGNTPVTRNISLRALNSCGSTNHSESIIIHRPTRAQFTTSSNAVCIGSDFTFTNNSLGENLTYEWSFGDGSTSTSAGPHTHNYTNPGSYDVQLIAKGYCGNDTITRTVVVHPTTIADVTPLDPIEGCSPMEVSFENNSSGANLSYQWRIDGVYQGNTTDLGPINFTEPPGNTPVTHTVQLRVNSACGVETTETIITVHPPTQANMNITPSEVCLGESFTASQNSLGENLSYEWDFGNGSTSTASGPHTIDYTAPGTYDVQFIALGYCGNDTITTPVTVHPYPIADFSPDLPNGCEVLEMTFTNNSTPSANQSWNFGPNASPSSSSNFNPGQINFPTAGVEEIILIVEENGCVSSDTNTIEIFPLPVVDFSLTPIEGCADLAVEINNNSVDNGVETFTWDLGNGTSFTGYNPTDQIYTALTNDSIYDIQLNVTSGEGCADSLTHQVTVHPVPVADFDFVNNPICLNENVNFINNSTPGMNYEWDFGDGNSSNSSNPSHQYANDGNYSVTLVVSSPFNCNDTITKDILVHPTATPSFSATTACFGYETEFADLSSGNIVSYTWSFGDGNTSSTQNPVHIYPNPGVFNAELTIENDFGCITDTTINVNVNDIPMADFSSANFCLGDGTAFTNLTTGSTVGMEWNFGDGSTLNTDVNPNHTFATIGDFDVQLVAFGGSGCSDTTVQTITINPVPTADFSFMTACANDTTFFTDLSIGSPDNYNWDFGNGITDNSNNLFPSVVYANDGTYNVSLTVDYNATGCSNTITYSVDAHPRTNPQFSANTACLETSTSFTDETTQTPVLWEWDFNDGTPISTLQNPTHIYANPGDYEVELVTENIFGCSDTLLQSVTVHPLPIPGFNFDTVCLNAPTHFIDTSLNATAWEYQFSNSDFANTSDASYIFPSDGNFSVQQVVTNSLGCTDTITETIIVRPNPVADFEVDTACFTYPSQFTNNSIDAIVSTWVFDDLGASNNIYSPDFTYSTYGSFEPQLVVENSFGCTDTLTKEVIVLPQPVASFTNNTVCAREVVNFNNTSSGSPILFEWNFDDNTGTFTNEDITHVFSNGGLYDVTLIVENAAGCSDTIIDPITVYTVPNVSFTADTVCLFDITQFNDLSTDATPINTWDWDFGDGNTSPDQNPTYIYQSSGTYDVNLTVTNINGCDSTFTDQVLVSLVPEADFDFTSDCFGAPTTFSDQSTNNPGIYLWDFGDGNSINGTPNEQHTYSSPGIYLVELQVLGSDSICSDAITKIVNVADGAQADFLIPTQVCVNDIFNFYDNSSTVIGSITNYEWIMSDGTIYNSRNGTHAFNTPGVHEITVNITTSDGCIATHTESIDVLPATTANFEWEGMCSNTAIQFTNTSTGGTTNWYWDFGDGTTNQTQFPIHEFANEGSYEVMLIVQNLAGCADTIVQDVLIYPSPNADFNYNEVCYGSFTPFTNTSTITSGNITSYQWTFGVNEGTSDLENPQHEFINYAQNHDVVLIATSNHGCIDSITKSVSLRPIVEFNVNLEDQFGCAPITVNFDNQSEGLGTSILNYSWSFGDGNTSFQQSPTHTFLEPGEYPVSLTVFTATDCNITLTDGLEITVFPSPVAAFDVNPPTAILSEALIKITDESQGAQLWEYDLGDGNYNNSPTFSHTFNNAQPYYITQYVQNEFGCSDSTIRAIEIKDDFLLFVPNAFTPDDGNNRNDYFTWEIMGNETFEMRVFNRWGELIFVSNDPNGNWDGSYNNKRVRDGVYVWQVKAMDVNGDERVITGHVSVLK
ncbi:hypothetical protein CW751_11795 [Brumimicrobium salinarum]|uniref:PKD domain-containing protein n=1 Tax=Brumimicrobium salinarum TaxID=2058658 RepID=A0A2I0R0D9_9FLAO|nr:PKD domain-containing protein [Brumimicrobium salinarum]PKR80044.1 hypothetical protein CW751_11795 [Brumimicrobium salinarum]